LTLFAKLINKNKNTLGGPDYERAWKIGMKVVVLDYQIANTKALKNLIQGGSIYKGSVFSKIIH